jgi:Predicted metal-dependent phosphoesterases (PHP family)
MQSETYSFIKIDFHSHTNASKDSLTTPEEIIAAARRRGLDRLVITDHNSIKGARIAQRLDPDLVIVGEEIMTQAGELLAAFVEEEIPQGLPVKEAIRRLRQQGAFISVSHPFDVHRSGFALSDLDEIAPLVDAVEVFNARCMFQRTNRLAQQYASIHRLGGTSGSDGHIAWEIGRAYLKVPVFRSAEELRQVICKGEPVGRRVPVPVHLYASFISIPKRIGYGR